MSSSTPVHQMARMTAKDRFIANSNRVVKDYSINSNQYMTTLTDHCITVDSVKQRHQCTPRDIANYIRMIQVKIKERQDNGIMHGIAYMESYINKILNEQLDMFLLATAKFKLIELTPTQCTVDMTMHRWTKRPSTVYQMIRIMLYCVFRQWKLSTDDLTVMATLTSPDQQRAFLPMGFRRCVDQPCSHDKSGIKMKLDWPLYKQLSQTPACITYH